MSAPDPLADRQEIRDRLASYCHGVDRLDLDLVRSVYARDGVDHHTGFSGTADEYVAWLARGLPRLDGTMHILGTHLCELYGDVALSETNGTAVHWGTPPDEPALNFTTGFRYVDRWVREDGSWRIAERFAVREWTRSDAGRRRSAEAAGPTGHRDRRDPWYVQRAAVLGDLGLAED
ncbi:MULTISPECIES: nuclear transport factor 2 family protein [unclassified Nocardioides]|uniref:nuclear transport factor 2 family protein n=1 Tax=unclassified Nocardioides TaxID=2615069 RepID=UPI0030148426